MAIQMRRGQEVNFDADKMLPGEWAVSLDTRYVRMCFAPGVCVRMATYDAFEVDMAKIEAILAECQTIEEVVTRINTEVSTNAKAVAEYTRQAKQYRDEAERFKNQASAIVGVDIATEDVPGLMAGGDNAVENGVLTLTKVTTSRTLTESQAGGIRIISMDGESQQKQYSGKNKLNPTLLTNLSVAWNEKDYSFSVLDSEVNKMFYQDDFKEKTSYTISAMVMHPTYAYASFIVVYTDGTNERASDCGVGNYALSKITTNANKTVDFLAVNYWGGNTSFKQMQIEEGSMTEYEPYVGGIASPNPEYPQSIDSVEISEIWTHGKNLQYNSATYDGWLKSNSGGTILDETYNGGKIAKYTTNWNHRYPPNRLFKAGNYTISFDAKVKTDGSVHIYSSGLGSGVSKNLWITASNTFSRYSHTFTLTEDKTGYIIPMIPTGSTVGELYIANIQVEEGSETEYEPYTETKATLSAPIVLRSIGNVKDVLCKRDGVFGVLRKIKKLDLSTITSWTHESVWTNNLSLFVKYNSLSDAKNVPNGSTGNLKCNRLMNRRAGDMTKGSINGIAQELVSLFVSVDGIVSSKDLVSYFAENETYIHYQLAEPTFEPLPLADQIALHKLESFGGVTYLFTDSTIEPIIEVEYGTSKVGGYALKGLNTADANALIIEQLKTLTNELATQIVAGSEA